MRLDVYAGDGDGSMEKVVDGIEQTDDPREVVERVKRLANGSCKQVRIQMHGVPLTTPNIPTVATPPVYHHTLPKYRRRR
jgi:hypothetical protein